MRWFTSLRRSGEFARLRRQGRHIRFGTLSAYVAARRSATPRIGITVSKAVGGAVVRNRVRRRVQGALVALAPQITGLPAEADLLFVLRPAAAACGYPALASDVAAALQRAGRTP